MTTDNWTKPDPSADDHLEVAVSSGYVSVSHISSLLRVIQATLREVAQSNEDTFTDFSQKIQPILLLFTATTNQVLVLRFIFSNMHDAILLRDLSSKVFSVFLKRFSQHLKKVPQLELWGASLGGGKRRRYGTILERRMEELRIELRHFPDARLRFHSHYIRIQGDSIEIS